MKRFLIILFYVLVPIMGYSQAGGEITFATHVIDPNDMEKGDYSRNYTISFKNTGSLPVVFTRCQCPCGCYVISHYPKEVIRPGDTGSISVSFYYQKGMIKKSVYLHTNIPKPAPDSGYMIYEFKVVGEFKE